MNLDKLLNDYVLIKRGKKPDIFYKKLQELYEVHPKTCLLIVRKLHKLGCWQDYFYLLRNIQNEELKRFIYTFLHNQLLRQDRTRKGNISRWLPREKSRFDIKLNFVDTYCEYFYPDIANKFTRRTVYRKFNSKLCKEMNLIVFNIGNPETHNKGTLRMLIKHYDRLDDNSKQQLVDKLSNTSIFTFGKLMIKKNADKKLFMLVFKNNIAKFRQELIDSNLYHPTNIPLLDTSISMAPYLLNAYMIIFVNDYNRVAINFRRSYFVDFDENMNIYDKIDVLNANLMPSDRIYQNNNNFVLSNKLDIPEIVGNNYWKIDNTPSVAKVKVNTKVINYIVNHDDVYKELHFIRHIYGMMVILIGIIITYYLLCF